MGSSTLGQWEELGEKGEGDLYLAVEMPFFAVEFGAMDICAKKQLGCSKDTSSNCGGSIRRRSVPK